MPACIEAIEAACIAHEAGATRGPASLGLTLELGTFHVKAGAVRFGDRTLIAAKSNVNLPGNRERHGRPTIQGVITLLDGDAGQPLALMDSVSLTAIRTGAISAVAAKHLALADAATATIVGCGDQSHLQLAALLAVRPLHKVFAVDSLPQRARDFAVRHSSDSAIDVVATNDLDGAIAESQIVVTCTTSMSPLLDARHLHPGLFVSAIGADNPSKQEIATSALAASRVVVDSLTACAGGGDLHHALAEGRLRVEDVHGELAAIVAGRVPGRRTREEIFVFDSVGTALQDAAAAALVYQRACEGGIGLEVDLSG
jgi:ornithine cyclodeaminase/alanine dehydrogenase-like protein (mu-crystallin family)